MSDLGAGEGGSEVGTFLLCTALDTPPPSTSPGVAPAVLGSLDAAYAALVSAANADDEADDAALSAMWRERQGMAIEAIREAL